MHVSNISVLVQTFHGFNFIKTSTRALIGREECLHESIVNIFVASRCFAFRTLIMPSQTRI